MPRSTRFARRAPAALAIPEVLAPSRTEHRSTKLQNPANVGRAQRTDPITAINETLEALVHGEHLDTSGESAAHHRSDHRVHPGRVPPAGEHGQLRRNRSRVHRSGSLPATCTTDPIPWSHLGIWDGTWFPIATVATLIGTVITVAECGGHLACPAHRSTPHRRRIWQPPNQQHPSGHTRGVDMSGADVSPPPVKPETAGNLGVGWGWNPKNPWGSPPTSDGSSRRRADAPPAAAPLRCRAGVTRNEAPPCHEETCHD